MKPFQTIVVGAGLDDRDPATMSWAAHFARLAGTTAVQVAHVSPERDLPDVAGLDAAAEDLGVAQRLAALVDRHRKLFPPSTDFRTVPLRGPLVPEMTRLAAQTSADLFCLGRRPAAEHDTLSDRAVALVRYLPCSVLVVPTGQPERFDRLLVPVDFSEHSKDALETACGLAAAAPGTAVTVQHIYDVPQGWHKSSHSYEEFAAIMRRHAEQAWDEFARGADTRGVAPAVRFDLSESVPGAILRAAVETDAGLIVMGSHGRTRSAAFLLGHVADRVCEGTGRAVLCVKKKGEVVTLLQAILQLF